MYVWSHGRILDIFLPGLKHSKVENPFYISASTSILDPNKTVLILIRQGCSPACSYGAYAYASTRRSPMVLNADSLIRVHVIANKCQISLGSHLISSLQKIKSFWFIQKNMCLKNSTFRKIYYFCFQKFRGFFKLGGLCSFMYEFD